MKPRACALLLLSALSVVLCADAVSAPLRSSPGDWPGWRGPDRTGLSPETGLLRQWPAGGPKLLWKATGLGEGYSTPSVADGRLFVMGTRGKTELLIALEVKGGKRLWAAEVGSEAGKRPAPRSTPTVDGDLVYALASDGKLACVTADGGKLVWKRDLKNDFGGRNGPWAYAESPLVDGDRLVCTPGGSSATLVCLDKKTGAEVWRSRVAGLKAKSRRAKGDADRAEYGTAGYSSAVVAEVGGVRQYVQFLAGGVVGVSASDGKLLWHYDEPSSGGANIATPIFRDGSVFAASAYGNGGGRAKIVASDGGFRAEQLFFVKSLQNHHGGVVLVGDHVYGTGGQALLCVSFKTGEVVWTARGVGKGSVAYADGHLYHRGERGQIALVEATPAGYREKGRFTQPELSGQNTWAHPVIAGGRLYLRDWDVLFSYDVKDQAGK